MAMHPMKLLPAVVGIDLVAASGLVHGLLTDRWEGSREVDAAVARLDRIPTAIGQWQGEPLEMDRAQLTIGGIDGHVSRAYVNRRTGAAVTVMVVCGRPGPISLHPPEVCYAGRGYEMTGKSRQEIGLGGGAPPATFAVGELSKREGAEVDRLRIYWAWKSGAGWTVPRDPRMTFAPSPFLYKMYVIRKEGGVGGRPEGDASLELMRELLPACEAALNPAPPARAASL
jgi:hypothetical protein